MKYVGKRVFLVKREENKWWENKKWGNGLYRGGERGHREKKRISGKLWYKMDQWIVIQKKEKRDKVKLVCVSHACFNYIPKRAGWCFIQYLNRYFGF